VAGEVPVASSDSEVFAIVYEGRLVPLVGPTRCYVFMDGLKGDGLRLALAMCLYSRELRAGRVPGPFSNKRAERWARRLLLV
jgi:hypothetical protein